MADIAREIVVEYNDAEGQRLLKEAVDRGQDMRKALARIGVHMHHSIAENFRAQGRPTGWQSLSPVTIERRREGGATGSPKILQDTGRMKMSVTTRSASGSVFFVARSSLEMGTNVDYAPDHQAGRGPKKGWVPQYTRKAHMRQSRIGAAVLQEIGLGSIHGASMAHSVRAHTVQAHAITLPAVPKREFVLWQEPEDIEASKVILLDHWADGK